MKISNKLFVLLLREKLDKAHNDLRIVDDILYYRGFDTIYNIRTSTEKQEAEKAFEKELEDKYPEVYKNLSISWSSVRDTRNLIKELLDGIKEYR